MTDIFEGLRAHGINAQSFTDGTVVIWNYNVNWDQYMRAVGGWVLPDSTDWAKVAFEARHGRKMENTPSSNLKFEVYEIKHETGGKYEVQRGKRLLTFDDYEKAQEWVENYQEQHYIVKHEEAVGNMARGRDALVERLEEESRQEVVRIYPVLG